MNVNQFECYKHDFVMSEIRKGLDSIATKITNTAMVEEEILNDIGRYLLQGVNNHKHKKFLRKRVYQGVAKSLKRSRRQHTTPFANLGSCDDEGQATEYDPEDVLADVNSGNLEVIETITLLAQSDRRKELILNAWANGFTDNKEISSILADTLGGKSESHRKYIQRFRNDCRTELSALAI